MNPEDINIIEKLDEAASKILNRPIPFRALVEFVYAVKHPEIQRLEPIARPRRFDPVFLRKQAD